MDITDKIKLVIDEKIRPKLALHGGDIHVVDFDRAKMELLLNFSGQCKNCPAADCTFTDLVAVEIKKIIPEIKTVKLAD